MSGKPTPTEVITDEVNKRLSWNVAAYGTPWTGEYGDTEFICMGVVEALEKAGYKIEEVPDER